MASSSSVATTCSGSMLTSKGVAQGREELHEALRARSLVGSQIMVNDIAGHDLVDNAQVATDDALCEPLLSYDIVLARHISSLPFLAAGLFIGGSMVWPQLITPLVYPSLRLSNSS